MTEVVNDSSRTTPDRELIQRLPRAWWMHQVSAQLVEFLGRVTFLLILALLIGEWIHTEQPATGGLFLIGIIAIALRWIGQQAAQRHALQSCDRISMRLLESTMASALEPTLRASRRVSDGETAVHLTRHIEKLCPYWQWFLPALIAAAIQPLAIVVLVASVDWLAGSLLLLTAPLIPLFTILIGMGTATLARSQHQQLARLSGFFLDRLQALPTLRLFDAIDSNRHQVHQATESLRQSSMRVLRVAFLSSAVLEFFAAVSIATLAIYVGLSLLGAFTLGPAEEMTLTRGLIILLLAPEFFAPLRNLAQRYHDRASARSAAPEVFDLVYSRATPEPASPKLSNATPPAIQLSNLQAGWPGSDDCVITGLDMEIAAGEWLTIYGPSGIGKSTLAAVMAGHLPPYSGSYLINDQPATPKALQNAVAWLNQQPQLLPGSLLHNIAPGDAHPNRKRIADLIEATGLGPVVNALPEQLNTRIGSGGQALSGGEAQRVCLARALYPGSRLLILDEPASRLDPEAERQLIDILRGLAGEHTIVLFAHSLAARQAADRSLDLAVTT